MFRILSLELVHWDYWQQFTLPLDAQIITIAGPNGSGKTTLLDAMRSLMALPCSGQRDYKRYLRHSGQQFAWLRAVVENRSRDGKWIKPFHPHQQSQVTLFCRFTSKGGEWKREFLIEDGAVEISSALGDSKHWMGVEQYRRRLAEAGLSSAVAKVLALEQGETDKLCEYSAKDLLNLVFTVFGDKEPLDNYQKARDDQRAAERELEDQKRELARLENELETLSKKADNHAEWKRLKAQLVTLTLQVLPTLGWLNDRASCELAERESNTLIQQQKDAVMDVESKAKKLGELQETLSSLAAENTALEAQHGAVLSAHDKARDHARKFSDTLKQKAALQQQAAEAGQDNAASLQASFEQASKARDALIEQRGSLRSALAELREQIAPLQSNTARPLQEDVSRVRTELGKAGIAHSLLVEQVEITDEHWRGAVEALLKPYPHLIVLHSEADAEVAWAIGERLGYRHFISAERAAVPSVQPGSVLDVVRFAEAPPPWLPQFLNRVQRVETVADGNALSREKRDQDWITPNGYHKERRGARDLSVAAREQRFGEGARRAALSALQGDATAAEDKLTRLAARVFAAEQSAGAAQAALAGITAASQLVARAAEFAEAAHQQPGADSLAAAALAAFLSHDKREKQVLRDLGVVEGELKNAQREADKAKGDLHLIKSRCDDAETRLRELAQKVRHDEQKLPAEWRSDEAISALRSEWDNYTKAEAKRELIAEELAEGRWEQDPLIVAKRDKYADNFKQQQQRAERRESDLNRLSQLTEDARGAYIGVLRRSVATYGSNIKRLGELAGIEVKHEMPHFDNDDMTLAQAGLNVRFNFDGKGLMGLNDGEASGGQQVMKSLILLMGLMMDECEVQRGEGGSGFVFIDEPFAHLDIVNIDRVGSFLRATRAQYLITTPLTHNVNVYQPTDVMLCTFKKKPGDTHAPPVALARRTARA